MLFDVVLHDMVVPVGVYPNVWVFGETEFHDAPEYTMSIGITGNTMDYMIGLSIVQPLTFIYIIQVSQVPNLPVLIDRFQ